MSGPEFMPTMSDTLNQSRSPSRPNSVSSVKSKANRLPSSSRSSGASRSSARKRCGNASSLLHHL